MTKNDKEPADKKKFARSDFMRDLAKATKPLDQPSGMIYHADTSLGA